MGFSVSTLLEPCQAQNKKQNISVIQTFMNFYATLYTVSILYTNLRKSMLNMQFHNFLFFMPLVTRKTFSMASDNGH